MAAETNDTEQEEARPKFELDGKEYELPELRELDIDEWMVVYKYSKVVLRDLMEIPDDPAAEAARVEKIEQPGVMKALFHIGYKRAHPKKTDAAVEHLVGQIKYLPMLEAMNEAVEGEEEPDAETDPTKDSAPDSESSSSEDEQSSLRRIDSETGNGSSASTTSSETPEDEPATTGTFG